MSANQYLRRAVELAQGGDNKSALAEVKRALEIEPDHPKGLIFRFTLEARLLRRAQRPGDAAVRYRAVLALDPENSEAKKMLREHVEPAAPTPSGTVPSGTAAQAEAQARNASAQASPQRAPAANGSPARSMPAREVAAKEPSRTARADASAARASRGMTSDMPTVPPPPDGEHEQVHTRAELVRERTKPRADAHPAAEARPAPTARKARPPASDPPIVEVASIGRARPAVAASGPAAQVSRAPAPAPRAAAPQPAPEPEVAPSPMDDFEEPSFADLPPPSEETPLDPERRIATRVSIEVDVGISSESNFFTGFSGDISEGGLFIATYNLVPIGAHVEVAFGVLGHEIKADAVVCWIREPIDINLMPGFGVRFVNLTPGDHSAISEFIHARAPMFFDDE